KASRRRLGVAAREWSHYAASRWANLVPLAVEFRMGGRNPGGSEPADDRNLAADVRPGSARTKHLGNLRSSSRASPSIRRGVTSVVPGRVTCKKRAKGKYPTSL